MSSTSAAKTAGRPSWRPALPVLGLIAATLAGLGLFTWAQRDAFSSVAQKAILFEQPRASAPAGALVNEADASVAWQAVTGTADGTVIVAQLDVPETGQRLTLLFRKNHDTSLPASHIIEVDVAPQRTFPDKAITDVGGLVAKDAPNEAGTPLSAATARIADGVFWIGLSTTVDEIDRNVRFLTESQFFDLLLTYASGQQVTLTFEKGRTGRAIFERVLPTW